MERVLGTAGAVIGRAVIRSAMIGGALVAGSPTNATTIENFQVKTVSDLVDLCDASPTSEHYVAAVNFCQGFAIGAYQYYLAAAAADPDSQFICIPDPPPTRNTAIAAFVAWVKSHSEYMSHPPVDVLFRYLGEAYPCTR
ncbi:MAG: hypothetical protein IPK66_07730 [Rhodospirillales bacterium]|nr:hypothetical protein [Rhodospirillales bacterium]